jgi:Glycosyl hydrolase family 63 C-terminal domain
MTAEERRLEESRLQRVHWKRWGPFVSDRAWGTVREDYSPYGTAWEYFPHDHARSRAYRWNEDGLAGVSDRHQELCLSLALWNGRDPILKERLFGLSGHEGNHGEDVKEYYFHLDSTPTHSFMRMLYKYPQMAFPYAQLVEENRRRDRSAPEYELIDTGVFDGDRYFDVFVEYAKHDAEDLLMRVQVFNRGPDAAAIHVLPTVWFRNTWSWTGHGRRGRLRALPHAGEFAAIEVETLRYGRRWLYADGAPELLFTENETNTRRLFGFDNCLAHAKDGINDYIVQGNRDALNARQEGTKAAAHYVTEIAAGGSSTFRLRLSRAEPEAVQAAQRGTGTSATSPSERSGPTTSGTSAAIRVATAVADPVTVSPFAGFDRTIEARRSEADEFYAQVIPQSLSEDARAVMRQSIAGMLWSKQFYHYVVKEWMDGDPAQPPPPKQRRSGRNREWGHLYNADVISMPDKWEFPWYAAWDLAFHCVALALVDSDYAKEQLILMLREWYLHPNGQLPAYEWAFGDVNPPVHAWAAWRVYKIEKKRRGVGDRAFLERVFQKLLLNFTWWVNRKDAEGSNVFEGGFLGLDNIGVFDRSAPVPTGGHIEQADGTSWMAMYSLNLLAIAMELARENPAYEDVASKFWEHFLYIGHAIGHQGRHKNLDLWNEEHGFFYDTLHLPDGTRFPLKVRSMVGLIPLFAVETLEPELLEMLQGFKRRLNWFIENRSDLTDNVACMRTPGSGERRLLSVVTANRLRRVLAYLLDEAEFLSPYGIRSLSRYHHDHPLVLHVDGQDHRVDYDPGESTTGLFGGNSNWRGPIWFPVNYLLVEALQKFHHYFGDDFTVECPTGSGELLTLRDVAAELSRRLSRIFLRGEDGRRAVFGQVERFQHDPHWRDYVPFHEYFHGDTARGLGASHQTGWTGLVAKLLQQSGE